MLSNLFIAPSLNSLFITGLLVLSIFFLFITHFQEITRLNFYNKISLLSLICLAVGVHGLTHLGVESQYGFNPYKWF